MDCNADENYFDDPDFFAGLNFTQLDGEDKAPEPEESEPKPKDTAGGETSGSAPAQVDVEIAHVTAAQPQDFWDGSGSDDDIYAEINLDAVAGTSCQNACAQDPQEMFWNSVVDVDEKENTVGAKVYAHIDFGTKSVLYKADPIPGWPLTLENLKQPGTVDNFNPVHQFFNPGTMGYFMCLLYTAERFEKLECDVVAEDGKVLQTWHEILTLWCNAFFGCTNISAKALWGKANRERTAFKKKLKCYKSRGQAKAKSDFLRLLLKPVVMPVSRQNKQEIVPQQDGIKLPVQTPQKECPLSQRSGLMRSPETPVVYKKCATLKRTVTCLKRTVSFNKKENASFQEQLQTVNQKCAVEMMLRKEAESQVVVGVKTRDLRNEIEFKDNEIERLKCINSNLQKQVKGHRELKLKVSSQTRTIEGLQKHVGNLVDLNMNTLDDLNSADRETTRLKDQVVSKSKEIVNRKKKLIRREKTITSLTEKAQEASARYQTDQASFEAYHNGIVESLEQRHGASMRQVKDELEKMKSLETFQNGKFRSEVRLMYYDLLTRGVSANIVQGVVRSVLDAFGKFETTTVKLPSRSTAQRMVAEAGYLAKIRATWELARQPDGMLGHHSDGTTKQLIHWGAHAIKLSDEKDPAKSNSFTLTLSPVVSGQSEDTVAHLERQFDEMREIADELGIDYNYGAYSVDRIGVRMSDRAANERKVTKILIERKRAMLDGDPIWESLSEAEKQERVQIYSFTCAAHKVDNMASAMTGASVDLLYKDELGTKPSKSRGMKGAKKHVYEVNKLLCERSRKEYSLGANFKAYNLSAGNEAGSSLFKPIVGNRYLIFLHNAIPTLSAKDIVMVYLEDVKDSKDKPGLNKLESSVKQSYMDMVVESETVAFALMYFSVCSRLISKAKSVESPLDMNPFYQTAIDALGLWAADATTLLDGTEEMWPGTQDDGLTADMMNRVRQMGDPDLVKSILQEMARAGMEKLADHAEEHLPGGVYHQPDDRVEKAGQLIGEATNDRIESSFGMLDRRLSVAPTSNPVNVGHLIAAKNDKVVQWAKDNITDMEAVCDVARRLSAKERKREGSRNDQLMKMYEVKKARKEPVIAKRRADRAKKERVRKERMDALDTELIRDDSLVESLTGAQLNEQYQYWKLLASIVDIPSVDAVKKFTSKRVAERKLIVKDLISENANIEFDVNMAKSTHSDSEPSICDFESDWSSSDEETLDTLLQK